MYFLRLIVIRIWIQQIDKMPNNKLFEVHYSISQISSHIHALQRFDLTFFSLDYCRNSHLNKTQCFPFNIALILYHAVKKSFPLKSAIYDSLERMCFNFLSPRHLRMLCRKWGPKSFVLCGASVCWEIKSQMSTRWTGSLWKPLANFNGTVPCWVLRKSAAHTHTHARTPWIKTFIFSEKKGELKKRMWIYAYTHWALASLKATQINSKKKLSLYKWYQRIFCISRYTFFPTAIKPLCIRY